MELFAILLGGFYLLALPILVFVALGRTTGFNRQVNLLKFDVAELQMRLRKLSPERATQVATETAKPEPVAPTVHAPMAAPIPTQVPATVPPVTEKIPEPMAPPVFTAPVKTVPEYPKYFAEHKTKAPIPAIPAPVAKSEDAGAEITLGARWATRLGIGFLVIAVVFFGIYISRFSTPLVRLLEVFAVAAGVTGLGLWLERQAREFGEAVFAGGLAMFYFAAFAAHVIPAMQIIPDSQIGLGLLVQYLAVGMIVGVACWRDRPNVSTMSIALGMVSCFFALHRGWMELSLGAALGLLLVATALRAAKGWVWPVVAGYVGAQLCYVGTVFVAMGYKLENFFSAGILHLAGARMNPALEMWPGFTLIFPTAYFLLLLGADTWAQMRGRAGEAALRTGAALVAAVLYGLGAWWGGAVMGNSWASHNLLAAAAVCLAAGAAYHRRRDLPELYEIFYAAAGTWLAIYFINEFTGWIRWLALLLESFVFAWRARRNQSPFAWACLYGAWICSGVMAFLDASRLGTELAAGDAMRLKFALWPLVSVALWTWVEKSPRPMKDDERVLVDIGGVLTAVAAVVLGRMAWISPMAPWMYLIVAVAVATVALVARARIAWPTATLSFLFAMWCYDPLPGLSVQEAGFTLAIFSALVIAVTGFLQRSVRSESMKYFACGAEVLGFLSLLYMWMRGFHAVPQGEAYLPQALMLAALELAVLNWFGPWRTTGDLAWVWAMVGLASGYFIHALPSEASAQFCVPLALGLGWLNGVLSREENSGLLLIKANRLGLVIPGLVMAGWIGLALPAALTPHAQALALIACAVGLAVVGRREWLPGAACAGIVLTVGAAARVFGLTYNLMTDSLTPLALSGAILFQGWLAARRFGNWDKTMRDVFLFVIAFAALVAFDVPIYRLVEPMHQYLTLWWAAAGAGVFITGLAARLRPYRYAGLAGMAVCVPRLFFVDITDQLERILAFGGLALMLLAIGFSYHKLRTWLVALDAGHPPAVK